MHIRIIAEKKLVEKYGNFSELRKLYRSNTLYVQGASDVKIIKKDYKEDKDFYSISATHNGYEKKFGYVHTRSIKISKKEDKIFGHDALKKTKKYINLLNYFISFHVYPDTKIVKTIAGNSILISLSNGEGWSLLSKTNNFEIEKNIFFGNKSKIMNNESILMSGKITEEVVSIRWVIERVN